MANDERQMTNDKSMAEIRWHARAGQGAVTAATILAAAALKEGLYIQAFPEFGPERQGAPIRAFNRLSKKPIRIRATVNNPDVVVVLDETLIRSGVPLLEGTADGAVVVVNSQKDPKTVSREMGAVEQKVFTVDATHIALDTVGRPFPNTPMLGALVKVAGLVKLENLLEELKDFLGKKFSPKVVDGNVAAAKRAYEEVKG